MKLKRNLTHKEAISKIMEKKEFSKLPEKDVERVFKLFDEKNLILEEKIKCSRDLLRKMYSVFASNKLLNKKFNSPEWFLKKHISTRERLGSYEQLYSRLLRGGETIFDFGAGVNGFSFEFFPKKVNYFALEAVGQLVDLMNSYFESNSFKAKAIHGSLFDIELVKGMIRKEKGKKVVFLFKVLDSLEMFEKNFSKKFLLEIGLLVEKIVVSYATESLISRKKFYSNRKWLKDFISENFALLEDFELGGEKYLVFSKR